MKRRHIAKTTAVMRNGGRGGGGGRGAGGRGRGGATTKGAKQSASVIENKRDVSSMSDIDTLHKSIEEPSYRNDDGGSVSDDSEASEKTYPLEGEILHEGIMEKKGGGTALFSRRNWKVRWFVLYSDVIKYYSSEQAARQNPMDALGEIVLEYAGPMTVENRFVNKTRGEVPHIFLNGKNGRIFELRGLEISTYDTWMSKIQAALDSIESGR